MNRRQETMMRHCDGFAAETFKVSWSHLRRPWKTIKPVSYRRDVVAARQLSVYLIASCLDVTHKQIAQVYGIHRTMVSKIVAKFDLERENNEALDEWLDTLGEGVCTIDRWMRGPCSAAALFKKDLQQENDI